MNNDVLGFFHKRESQASRYKAPYETEVEITSRQFQLTRIRSVNDLARRKGEERYNCTVARFNHRTI